MIQTNSTTQSDTDSTLHCEKSCAFQGCTSVGEFPAPKSRDNLSDRIWFCLEHIRVYNADWNYYAGMNVGEIDSHWRSCATWERPTWPLGSRYSFSKVHDSVQEQLKQFARNAEAPNAHSKLFAPGSKGAKALKTLEITGELTPTSLKKAYKKMVKKHHPDANQGCKQSEEKLKEINEAYAEIRNQKSEFRN